MSQQGTTAGGPPDAARRVFEPRAGRRLTDEDVREIRANLAGFFAVLAEWDRPATAGGCPAAEPPIAKRGGKAGPAAGRSGP